MWKIIVERGRPQMAIWLTLFAFWITKATNTHSEYVIHIPFPQQQWLNERVSLLSYTCISPLVFDSYNKQLFSYRAIPVQRGTIYFLRPRNGVVFLCTQSSFKKTQTLHKIRKMDITWSKKIPLLMKIFGSKTKEAV
jgi:hypothetical protein